MIHYIYGAPGSGKTYTMLNYLKSDVSRGKKAFFIVPEQETVAVERAILTLLPHTAQMNIEVLNFSRLCNTVFRKFGGISYNFAIKPLKSLVMWNTLRELSPMLEEYNAGDASDLSLSQEMLSAVSELKAYCITPEALDKICKKLDISSPIYKKMRDISLIYSAYTAQLSEHFSDSSDDISRATDLLRENCFFGGANIYIDSFAGFTKQELLLIKRISEQCDDIYISLPIKSPNDISVHTESLRYTATQLKKLLCGEQFDEIYLIGNHRTKSDALKYLSDNLWCFDASSFDSDTNGAISVIECETPYSEAECVAQEICRSVRNGNKYGDIAIILRNAEKYRGILDVILSKYEIPFFFSEKTDFMTKPLTKYLFSALKIKENGWRAADVIAYLKSGFSGIDPFDVDIFEDYITTWNIHGNRFFESEWTMNPDGYKNTFTARGERILARANDVKSKLVPTLSLYFTRLDASVNVREMCEATLSFLKDSDITQKVRELCQKSLEQGGRRAAEEDTRLYSLTLSILYDLSNIFGDRSFTFSEFSTALTLMLSESEIGSIPTSADEVTVGSASMLRASGIKHAVIMGLNEGEFPAAVKDSRIFGDTDKKILEELGMSLSADVASKTSEELFFALRAVCAPSEKLTLTYSALSSDGSSQRQSIVIGRIKRLFPTLTIDSDKLHPKTDKIWNTSLLKEVYPSLRNSGGERLIELFEDTEEANAFLERLSIPVSNTECTVSEEITDKIFGERISMTPSRLEKYVMCGFDYYCTNILRLRESKKAAFQLNDIGSFIHNILEKFMREISAEGKLNLSISDDEISEILEKTVENYLLNMLGEDYSVSNRTRHLFLRLNRLSFMVAKNLLDEFRHSDFYPSFFELKVGMGEDGIRAIEFELNDGRKVCLCGIADRVDTYKKDGNVYIRVVDYKTGSKEFSIDDLKHGLNTQLLIYLFSICYAQSDSKKEELGAEAGGSIIPAGIQYLSSNAPIVSLDEYCANDEIENLIQDKFTRSGLLTSDPDILRAINHNLDPKIISKVKKCDDGTLTGKNIVGAEQFDELYSLLEDAVTSVAYDLTGGKANAKPLRKGQQSPCRFCKMKSICRASAANKK